MTNGDTALRVIACLPGTVGHFRRLPRYAGNDSTYFSWAIRYDSYPEVRAGVFRPSKLSTGNKGVT